MDTVKLEITDRIAVITINRPEKRNALSREVREDLYQRLEEVDSRKDVRVAVITGAGEAFMAGGDIAPMKDAAIDDLVKGSERSGSLFSFVEKMRVPVIAAVNGWALGGGCELAVACDIRICSDNAKFGQSEVKVGLIAGYEATIRLLRLIGTGKTKELIYTGRMIDAAEAERIGLVNAVVSKETLMDEVMKLARELAKGPASMNLAKQAINKAFDLEMDDAAKLSSKLYRDAYNTHDAREGIHAFLEKRKPEFTGE